MPMEHKQPSGLLYKHSNLTKTMPPPTPTPLKNYYIWILVKTTVVNAIELTNGYCFDIFVSVLKPAHTLKEQEQQ